MCLYVLEGLLVEREEEDGEEDKRTIHRCDPSFRSHLHRPKNPNTSISTLVIAAIQPDNGSGVAHNRSHGARFPLITQRVAQSNRPFASNALDGQNATPQHHQGSCRYPSGILVSNVICQG